MKISSIFETEIEVNINSLMIDSRKKAKNSMFFCIEGLTFDGHDFVDKAIKNGAICIVHSKQIETKNSEVIYIRVNDVIEALNTAISIFFNYSPQNINSIGVTGTAGKTSVAYWLREVLSDVTNCAYMGSKGVVYSKVVDEKNITTPDTITLGLWIGKMIKAKVETVVMEVSSITNELRNNEFIEFQMGIFTNITSEHLDFHGTFSNYLNAKGKLFDNLASDSVAIINIDDDNASVLMENTKARIVTFGINKTSSYQAFNIETDKNGTSFELAYNGERYPVRTNLLGKFTVYNLLAVIAAACEKGMELESILSKVEKLKAIAGRMERIREGQDFEVIIDFAHTPESFKNIFEYARQVAGKERRIISVFGAPGKRDTNKRKKLGEMADKYSDLIILTMEDPRNENDYDIAMQIKSGISKTINYYVENREMAIEQAINTAQKGDVVLILAKGDERFIDEGLAKTVYNYKGDAQIARERLKILCDKVK